MHEERVARDGALARLRASAPMRLCFAHPDVTAALLLGLFVLLYLWPALIGGDLLSPISVLYGSAPWAGQIPSDVQDYLNPLLSDVPTADYPWRFLVRELLHNGTFPAWNPHVFAGIPLYSNPQTGLFSPFSLPLWVLPLNYGIGVGAALKLWAGGFGTYLLVRQLKLGFLPGLLAGVCFSFSAINIVWLTHETLPAVAAMLPWMLWMVERIFQGRRLGSALGLAVATAIALGGGHPGMQVHVLAFTAVYALLRLAFSKGDGATWRERLQPLWVTAGGLVLGTLLMAVMLVPEALSSRDTIGTIARSHGRGTLPGTDMPFTTIRTTLFPDWWGRPSGFEAAGPITELAPGVSVSVNYNERTLYAGVVAALMACVALVAPGGWRRKGPFAILALLGLAIPLHLPGLYQLITHLPVFEMVQNQRLHFVWALGVSVLAAFGLQAVLERPAGDRRRLAVGLGAVLVGLVALAAAGASGTDVSDTISHFFSGRTFESDGVLALTSVAWYLLFALGVGGALLAAHRWPRHRVAIAAAVVALAAVDMLHFAGDYQPMAPASKSIPPRTEAVAFLQERRDQGRFMGLEYTLANDWPIVYGLNDVRGYDPPQPSLRYYRLWRTANPEQLNWTAFTMEALSDESLQVASVLGARWLVTPPGVEVPEGGGPAVRGLRTAYDGEDARIFENPRAAPRALVPARVREVAGEDEARAALLDPGFDPRADAVVEGGDGAAGALPAGAEPVTGRAAVTDEENARVVVRATLDRPGVVVLNDNFSPGWTARVDGRDTEILRVNDVMRGVAVGAGEHEVEWSYAVPGLRAGAVLSALALLGLVVGLGVWWRSRRRTAAD